MKIKILKTLLVLLLFFPICTKESYPDRSSSSAFIISEYSCITEALWHESRGETKEGIRAVLAVIHNRKEHSAFPSTYCKVIHQKNQFSYIIPGKGTKQTYKASEQEVKGLIQDLAFQAATGAFRVPPELSGVMWYHNNKVKPQWSYKLQKVHTIGLHHFYRLKEFK